MRIIFDSIKIQRRAFRSDVWKISIKQCSKSFRNISRIIHSRRHLIRIKLRFLWTAGSSSGTYWSHKDQHDQTKVFGDVKIVLFWSVLRVYLVQAWVFWADQKPTFNSQKIDYSLTFHRPKCILSLIIENFHEQTSNIAPKLFLINHLTDLSDEHRWTTYSQN